MSIRKFLENEIIAAGERVLGKKDSFSPVVFYLCKNGEGDLCTPWIISNSAVSVAEEIVQTLGNVSEVGFTLASGYINMHFTDKFISDSINKMGEEFKADNFSYVIPDDSTESFIQDYCVYRACNIEGYMAEEEYFTGELREVAVAVIGAEVTGNKEVLKKAIEKMCRKNAVSKRLLRAAACVLNKK